MAYLVEFLDFSFAEGLLVAQQVGDESDLCEVLYGFHLHVGTFERRSKCDHAMICHQDGVMAGNKRRKSVGQFGGAGSAVAGQGDRAQADDDFADQGTVQIQTRGCESGCGWRMGVNDAVDVGTQVIDQKVHSDLARNSAFSGNAFSVHVNDDHVGGAHSAFADTGGGHEEVVFVETDGEVSVGGGDEPILVQSAAELHNCLPMLAVIKSGHLLWDAGVIGFLPQNPARPMLQQGLEVLQQLASELCDEMKNCSERNPRRTARCERPPIIFGCWSRSLTMFFLLTVLLKSR